jgi:hypothetical protein
LGGECVVIFSPEHASMIATAGWKKQDVRAFLYERARKPLHLLKLGGMYGADTRRNLWSRWVDHDNPDAMIPPTRHPEDILILVAGGAGKHSVFLPGWGSRSVTKKIIV